MLEYADPRFDVGEADVSYRKQLASTAAITSSGIPSA